MTVTLQNLKDAAAVLPIAERAELARFLLHSLDEGEQASARTEWLALAERRMAEVKAGKVVGIPAEEVLRTLLAAAAVKPIDFHPDAAAEAREAAARYEAIQPGLGVDFREELDAALARIRSNPQMYAAESGAIRMASLHRFPYSVIYEELADRLWIAAVGHHSRRPGYWSHRHP